MKNKKEFLFLEKRGLLRGDLLFSLVYLLLPLAHFSIFGADNLYTKFSFIIISFSHCLLYLVS